MQNYPSIRSNSLPQGESAQVASTRRHFLSSQAMGLGGLAVAWLLQNEAAQAETIRPELEQPSFDLKPKPPHHEPQARAMISLWM